ncbi:MAG: sigma-54-dependent Fis family transcriptional regulator [Bacteriovoracaceae bacterium]|nr:sigma-54-dependent Fis family transcriptional regulator [Bacteriovoracaceae bacterium]
MRILIVDDEKLARFAIKQQFQKNFEVYEADNFFDAKKILETKVIDIAFIDLRLDDSDELMGLKLIPVAVKRGIYSVVMSSYSEDETVDKAYDLGCKDFYAKGNEDSHVSETLTKYLLGKNSFNGSILTTEIYPTKNPIQKEIIESITPFISTKVPLYISGETGSGKTFLAEGIHRLSKRTGKFIQLNCGAISKELLEAELFGYGKGAYSGAVESAEGKLMLANGGTLFLDEVGSMPEAMQIKLLKALEEKKFYAVNSDKEVKSDFSLICGGWDNLDELVKQGKFRFDLYQRICGFRVRLLPLRERIEDIIPTIKKKISEMRKVVISKEAEEALLNYSWPGNLREAIRFAEIVSRSSPGRITVGDVNKILNGSKEDEGIITSKHYELAKQIGLESFLELMKNSMMQYSVDKNGGVKRKAIEELKISTATYYGRNKKKKLNNGVTEIESSMELQ